MCMAYPAPRTGWPVIVGNGQSVGGKATDGLMVIGVRARRARRFWESRAVVARDCAARVRRGVDRVVRREEDIAWP